ncbi:MAG TPA: prepilin-type N-terminal cleavage/methylation domain-containing protein [Elusimicrobiota bacterium]|nr:prepilin-type N-terminal cleavage/methylation domain-containing protein [Elusimicrobiota bacterium]HNA59851.1 prepilin-type N-terminal cleavage/methylation domain-containing protein [Elusimicrobiota bacterium]HNC74347.1 prepilin-type N-terminal cleavage/methylation domain-containing protein [Elusimicrobiota bacterium]HNI56826.1 prepilin-type N-terminal cleavage/methylation domain-containing protein [Elusimicrobiota bacterium]
MKPSDRGGFTLIELMIVVAIIGLLAAIALPKFANLVTKAREATIKGKLGSLRSALSLYYADTAGLSPFAAFYVGQCLAPRYIESVPSIQIPGYPSHVSGNNFTGTIDDAAMTGGFPWCYISQRLVISCTHTDSKGTVWSEW